MIKSSGFLRPKCLARHSIVAATLPASLRKLSAWIGFGRDLKRGTVSRADARRSCQLP
jgi:hypothetical protein